MPDSRSTHRTAQRSILLFMVLAVTSTVFSSMPARAAALVEVTSFGTNPGNLKMFKYTPTGLPSNAPLVVAMHGCTQSAASYDDESGWVKYADLWKFALVFPQQQSSNNANACFNWFEPGDYARGAGESLSIKQMTDKMKADHSSDPARIFVTGLSSGGAMTSVMLATYPDVFKGGSVVAGIPYKCASSVSEGFNCMSPGKEKTPTQWGDLVRGAYTYGGTRPTVTLWHGTSDSTVNVMNQTESMEQWTNVHGIDQTPDVQDTIKGYPHKVYKNAGGAALVETYAITSMSHGTPLDPGAGSDQCGTAGAYMLDVNICSTYFTAKFWGLDNTDSVAPTVSITSPAQSATVSGNVTIQANASDNVGVTKVEFYVDGILTGTDAASPWDTVWSSGTAANGSHALTAKAFDAAGNNTTSAPITVTVTGGIDDTTPPTVNLTFPTNGSSVSGTVTLTATASDNLGVTSVEFFIDGGSIGNGTPSGQAGPWTLAWNTTGLSAGSHAIMVKAYDAKGNVGTDNDTSVTVNQNVLVLDESFSDRDANSDYFDVTGWTAGGYVSSTDNNIAQPAASNSTFGYASSGVGCVTGQKTQTLSRSITLSSAPKLTYFRKLDLKALINTSTTASFKVKINSAVVDQQAVTYANYTETAWTQRAGIDLAAFANQAVTLAFEVAANSNVCLEAWGKAWIDDITIGNPSTPSDVTPPTVNVTAPTGGSTVSGTVDINASASDNIGVTKVEFYVDGTLLGVDTSSPYSITWITSGVANGSHALMAKAYDAAANSATDDDTSVTVSNSGGGTTSVVFDNDDANDGYVKANADGTGAALGTLESTYGLAIGRGSDGKFNRSVLSFNTASIPDGATITRAYVTVAFGSISGDPWANPANNELVVDVKTGCFAACTIEAADWGAAVTASAAAKILKFTSGSTNSSEFAAAGLSAVNKTGTTQLKLRFSLNQTAMNYIFIKRGIDAKLHIDYV